MAGSWLPEEENASRLMRDEGLLHAILDAIPVGVVVLNPAGEVAFSNRARRAIWGCCPDHALHPSTGTFTGTGRQVQRGEWPEDRALAGETVTGEVVDICGADGCRRTVVVSAAPIVREGAVAGVVGVTEDITEYCGLKEQLLQAQKLEAMGVLAGGMAHDFNNLLTAINGYTQIIQAAVPQEDDTLHHAVEQVLMAGSRAAELTGNLVAFSSKQVLDRRPVAVNDIIRSLSRIVGRILGEDIEFDVLLSPDDLRVMADAGQLEQTLVTLLAHAREAMPEGGRISLSTEPVTLDRATATRFGLPGEGNYVLIALRDTGPALAADLLEHIFEPFYVSRSKTSGGLGLSAIYGIVRQHGGTIIARSAERTGTVFSIYLPASEVEERYVPAVQTAMPFGGSETLLVVEDEEVVRAYLKSALAGVGYTVLAAGEGEGAIEIFRRHPEISLVVTDVIMPRMNGRQLLQKLRKIRPSVPALFISGYTADVVEERGLMEPGVDFLMKPVGRQDLLRKVREILDEGPSASTRKARRVSVPARSSFHRRVSHPEFPEFRSILD